jgi:hypothetical protein
VFNNNQGEQVMNFLEQLSDDQIALFACVLAILFSVGVLAVIPGVRQWASGMLKSKQTANPRLLRLDKRASSF